MPTTTTQSHASLRSEKKGYAGRPASDDWLWTIDFYHPFPGPFPQNQDLTPPHWIGWMTSMVSHDKYQTPTATTPPANVHLRFNPHIFLRRFSLGGYEDERCRDE